MAARVKLFQDKCFLSGREFLCSRRDSEALPIDNRYRFSHFDMHANKHNKHVAFADLTDFLVTVPM